MIQIFARMEVIDNGDGNEYRYFFNPSNSEFKRLLRKVEPELVRGLLIEDSKDLIIFDSSKWTHSDIYQAAVNVSSIPVWLGDGVVEVVLDYVDVYSSRFDSYAKGGEDKLSKFLAKSLRIREAIGSDFSINFVDHGESDEDL